MTLHDLTEQLFPHFPSNVQKDLKTAVRVLAQTLGYPDAKSCPLEACLKSLPDLYHALETHLTSQGKSPHTIRNTKNNISRLFRLAETQKAFSLLPPQLRRQFSYRYVPHRPHGLSPNDGSYLRRHNWPAELEAEFAQFSQWATDPLVEGRDAKWKKRLTSLKAYESRFEAYFGYLHHKLQISPVRFDHLFDITLIERFVSWHINEKWHRPTHVTRDFVRLVHAMVRQYRPNPTLETSLKSLRKRMPAVRTIYNKSDAWVPLQEIERVGLALWPSTSPEALLKRYWRPNRHHVGQKFATRAGVSLMLRLWVHIPYRQRNMREMKLDKNLYRTPTGQWRIRFADEEMKIATRRGAPNVFDLPFPPTLVKILETYLTIWRPLITYNSQASEVFLNKDGQPFNRHSITRNLQSHIYSFTGRRWHPHIMRTVWATEWIQSSGDFMTAAIMLNDHLETVIKNYSHLREENVAENAYLWVQNRVNHHHPSS